jgi:hypothetical protein
MSAADRQRSWRSANEDSCRDHGRRSGPSGGPKARKKDAGLAASRNREAIPPQSRGVGPQSRSISREWGAKSENGAENGPQSRSTDLTAGVQHGIQAMQPGQTAGGDHGQRQMQACGSPLRNRVLFCNHKGGHQDSSDKMIGVHRLLCFQLSRQVL